MEDKALDRARNSHLAQMDQLKYAIDVAKENDLDHKDLDKEFHPYYYVGSKDNERE